MGTNRVTGRVQHFPIPAEGSQGSGPRKRMRWDAILDRIPQGVPVMGAEIGVLKGNTAMRLLAARPMLMHVMIDPWCVPDADSSYAQSGDSNSQKPKSEHEAAYLMTKQRVHEFGDRAIIHRAYSAEVAPYYEDESLDYVFIDGDHSYEGVKLDISLWLPKIKPGGWIGGHDYGHEKLPGVQKAVDEAFPTGVEKDDNRTWFYRVR